MIVQRRNMNDPKRVLQIRLSYQTTDANVQNALYASVKHFKANHSVLMLNG